MCMPFLIQRTHAQGTDLSEGRARLSGKRVQEHPNMLFLAEAALKPPQPNIKVTSHFNRKPCRLSRF